MKIFVKTCARCGENHDVEFTAFSKNPIKEFTHWGMCLNTNEPVVMKIISDVVIPISENPDITLKGQNRMRLECGSGYHPMNGFEHLDINPNCPHVEYNRGADDLSIFLSNSIEELRACDVLEHFSYRDTIRVLREWYRVLKPGGKIYIQCPDAKHLAKQWLEGTLPIMTINGSKMPIEFSASYWIMGGQEDGTFAKQGDDWRFNAHYTLFSPESLAFYLGKAGFKSWDIQGDGGSNLVVWAYK